MKKAKKLESLKGNVKLYNNSAIALGGYKPHNNTAEVTYDYVNQICKMDSTKDDPYKPIGL